MQASMHPISEEESARIPVLYVEDEPVNVLLMQALFEYRPQFNLLTATRGSEACEIAAARAPALLLLDLHLPDCHGADLLRRLRGLPGCARIPAIAVTADRDFDPTGSGFDEVWLKPFLLFHTLARIDRWLSQQPRPSTAQSPDLLRSVA